MERLGSIGINSALIQDPTPAQESGNGGIHRKPAEFGKAASPGGGGAIWARGAGDRDPLFPEPGTGPSKAFNGGATRWGGNEPKKWAGVRPGEGERRAVPPGTGVQGAARRWDETRTPGRAPNWVNDATESENWRGSRAVPRNNDIPWRKGDGRREGAGALPGGTFGGTQSAVPSARAGVGARPSHVSRAAAGVGAKYSKADLMDVFYKMKDEVGDEIPPPDDVVDANDFREIWRPIADQHHHAQNDQAHVLAPPGLDPYHVVKSQLEQVSKHFMSVDIPFPLQALQLDQYFYKDPAGNVQGPFPSLNLKSWNDQGYLYDDLQCQSAAARDTFFPFANLKTLWEVGESLGLQPAELQRLADAEARFGSPQMEEHGVVEDVRQGMQAIPGVHGINHVEQHMQAVTLEDQGEHAQMHSWVGAVPEQAVDIHAVDTVQPLAYEDLAPLQPSKPEPSYDPIDDIIDEPNSQRPAIDPRDGGRVLQPFGGMGSDAAAADPVTSMPQSRTVQQPQAQAATQPMQQQHTARMLAADPILNIPVHVERSPAPDPVRAALATVEAASGLPQTQFISPYDLFEAKQPASQSKGQATARTEVTRHVHAEASPAYSTPARPSPVNSTAVAPGGRGWGSQPAPQRTGVPLADIQREELVKRQKEEAAAQAAAQANAFQEQQERERRAAWTAQPQPVPLRQIMEDEECAAELEGGYDAGKEDYGVQGYNPWQAQSALPQEPEDVHAGGNDNSQVFWDVPVQPAARAAAAPRTAAQVVGREQAKPQARRVNAASLGSGKAAAWQATPSRPAAVEKVKQPVGTPSLPQQSIIAGDMEPEFFRNSPDFREWCMKEMERLQGNENVLVVLLETGANFEIMEIARSNLKGDNIGAFVAEFIKRKAQAQAAKAPGRRRRRGGAAAPPPAVNAAPAPSRAEAMISTGAGDGFVSVAGKGRGGKKKGAQPAAANQNTRVGGNAFAMLPSL